MEGIQDILNQVGQYLPAAIMIGVPAAIGVYMARTIPKQNREQYQEFQQIRAEFDSNSEGHSRDELVSFHKRMEPISRGLIIGKKAKEIEGFTRRLNEHLFIHVRAEIKEHLEKNPYSGEENLEDTSRTYKETLSPRRR